MKPIIYTTIWALGYALLFSPIASGTAGATPDAVEVEVESPEIELFDDDLGPDGLKRRGDGSIDDSQPGSAASSVETASDRVRERSRETLEDGTEIKTL
ncbi:MAG: hypothetical protein JRC77_08725, partial [Deltaproteobacteria bacterium]|nr:hypothetical protein [Deltaproteobacteria bacterium]